MTNRTVWRGIRNQTPEKIEAAKTEEVRARLRGYAEIADLGAKLAEWLDREPHRACSACDGRGRTGAATIFADHAGNRVTPVEVFLETCEACRGGKTVAMTRPEIEAAYRELRGRLCREWECTPSAFDELVRGWLPESPTPGNWLTTAREIARKGKG